MKRLTFLLLMVPVFAHASDMGYRRDELGGCSHRITDANGSPVVLTVDLTTCPMNLHVDQVVEIYDVRGNFIVDGLYRVAAVSSNTFTIKNFSGNLINSSGAYHGPYYQPFHAYTYGWVAPMALGPLADHPRGMLDGPNGTLTLSLSDPTGRANPQGLQYQALVAAFNRSTGYQTWTDYKWGGGIYPAWALKWFVDGKPTAGALYDAARWQPTHPWIVWSGAGGACNESQNGCGGQLASSAAVDFISGVAIVAMQNIELAYSTMSPSERQMSANFWLNDNSNDRMGLGIHDSPQTGCTPPPCTDVPGASGCKESPWQWPDDSHHYCGAVWIAKHHQASMFADPTVYPTGGGNAYDVSNIAWTKALGYFMIGLTHCGMDGGDPTVDRGCRLMSAADAYIYDHLFSNRIQNSSPRSESNDYYGRGRTMWMCNLYVHARSTGFVGSPSLRNPAFSADMVYESIYDTIPYQTNVPGMGPVSVHWGQTGNDEGMNAQNGFQYITTALWNDIAAGGSAAKYGWYWLQSTTGQYNASNVNVPDYLLFWYIFVDPQLPAANINTLPLQRILWPRSRTSQCSFLSLNCTTYSATNGFQTGLQFSNHAMVSRTDWTATSTLVTFDVHGDTGDGHASGYICPGCIAIYKNATGSRSGGALAAGDSETSHSFVDGYYDPWAGVMKGNLVEVGGTGATFGGWCQARPNQPAMTRWAGVDPTGPADDSYAYAMADLTGSYCQNVTEFPYIVDHLWKHTADMKKGKQFVIVVVDGSANQPVKMREYFTYRLNADDGDFRRYSPGISLNRSVKTVSLTDSTLNVRLNSRFLSIGSAKTYFNDERGSDTDLSFTGGTGQTGRVEIGTSSDGVTLGAASTARWAHIHQICADTTCTLPPSQQPSCVATAGECFALEIDDPSFPKVAIFGMGGLVSGISVSTSHSGTAQVLVAGLKPSTYAVTVNGVAVGGSPFAVAERNNSLEFESSFGAIQVRDLGSSGSSNPCDLNIDGTIDSSDLQLIVSALLAGEYTAAYDLNHDGVVNVKDLQLTVKSTLTGSCAVK